MVTKIEWCEEVWNPVTGCTKVSAGCKHCYAETIANRFWGARPFTEIRCHEDRLDQPLRWRKPRRVFVNSMSDLFHEDVPDKFLLEIFRVMAVAYRHVFQVLTKRPERMRDFCSTQPCEPFTHWPPRNVWLGVSCEDQKTADERIPILLETPAAVRFVSAEPLLDGIDFTRRIGAGISWLICGGESGPKARPCDIAWIRSIVKQCLGARVPCFVKQLGGRPVSVTTKDASLAPQAGWPSGTKARRDPDHSWRALVNLRHGKGGDPDEWPEDIRVRQMPDEVRHTL